ncbi:ribosome biogenesis GTP-binding protein YihA/YsxC [Bisgaard Taxon 10/6]|uniref:ribosome biogenesis GTP-binding protein YihA/YsxC n=1 Tax=Exercitatus varius TaxID=67857 RepID=UPI00294ACE5E|nr:ribosome biogenesis GTP-binding protein YihA/YsxC [Exercitatus varius]MDG2918387.1 ribosome biogenesis GTP-binding protein YihA/YsxC [Exercitatus varius]MDG2942427.1 ribosome biogenesis GTP-binding protein YihA/YsxC [Exercitatus varius]MDG2953109.1 ribosome biogenesis GTP-binding protein YihA/YsxC [Exercitatus varius]MDG2963184.1 ribosome biogenesis GTP-binding protein YihA/YsxC [Exercitatus varius]
MSEIKLNYHKTRFLTSAANIKQLPEDKGIEIAFAGRSNAGKSTALNALTNQKNLARTSKTPGRTQLINLFEAAPNCKLVDLPGYGYAAVPEQMKLQWQKSLAEYLQKRECLGGVVILMDIRHPLKDLDQQMIEWAVSSDLAVLLLLTKADKLSQSERSKTVKMIREAILPFQGDIQVEAFSAQNKLGIDRLSAKLNEWFAPNFTTE